MDRNCAECIYQVNGACSTWECKGTVTVEDMEKKLEKKKNEK